MSFELPALPYAMDALQPHISARTLEFHYGKHHQTYVTNLNKLVEGKPEAKKSLEELVRSAQGGLFNNAAQTWNHTFYWSSLSPHGGGRPKGKIAELIQRDFGSADECKRLLGEAAKTHFGSGWGWLVLDSAGKLQVLGTHDADNPMRAGHTPLLTVDVWEHAYYLDYQNARPRYVETVLENLIHWDFANQNLEAGKF
jgi:Fe-Mn family superoxide dismutase